MAFTKINAAGIGSTETVTLDGLTVINDGSFGGNVSVGGTLTYEDVTNIDSVGLITARAGVVVGSGITLSQDGDIFATGITTVSGNVKVGTGITLSPDGDVFFTGIATGNGSGLTALNASNIGSGTVPTARLGSGTASSSTFLRGDSTFQTVNTDLVSDTSPQLGGNLDVNTKNIVFGDSSGVNDDRLKFGASGDLQIYHDSNDSYIHDAGTGHLNILATNFRVRNADSDEVYIVANDDGGVELYYDNTVHLATDANGIHVTTNVHMNDNGVLELGTGSDLLLYHNATHSYLDNKTGKLHIRNNTGTYHGNGIHIQPLADEESIVCNPNGTVKLYYDNNPKFETTSGGATVTGRLLTDGVFIGEGGNNDISLSIGANNDMRLYNDGSNSHILDRGTGGLLIKGDSVNIGSESGEFYFRGFENGSALLRYDNSTKIETTSYGTHVTGYQTSSSYVGFHVKGTLSDHGFGGNHGSGITNFDVDYYSPIPMFSSKTIDYGSSYLSFPSYASGNYVKFTAPVAGLYQLELIASVETHHGGDWFAFGWEINTTTVSSNGELMNNGRGTCSTYQRTSVDAGAGSHFSTTIYMEANDYAILYQQSAAAVRFASNQYFVRGHLIH